MLIETRTPQKLATLINYNIHNKKSCYFLTFPIQLHAQFYHNLTNFGVSSTNLLFCNNNCPRQINSDTMFTMLFTSMKTTTLIFFLVIQKLIKSLFVKPQKCFNVCFHILLIINVLT
jgi:hypothetical protein